MNIFPSQTAARGRVESEAETEEIGLVAYVEPNKDAGPGGFGLDQQRILSFLWQTGI